MAPRKVSLIIPVYNGDDYLAEAIESALAQSYGNIEVLVVNDGSNDGGKTERVAQSYREKIRYFAKPNGGVASALNRAIVEMSGDYFSWLSHDDLYTADKVEKEMNALSRIGRDDVIIYSDYSVFTDVPDDAVPTRLKGVLPEHFRYWITVENRLHGCTLLVPRRAFEEVGGFNEKLRTTQDYDLWFRMAKEFSFIHIPEVLVKARSHPDQGTRKMAGIALTECNALLSHFIRDLSQQEIISATGKPLVESYIEIAASMFKRGFNDAGELAEEFAKKIDIAGSHKSLAGGKNRMFTMYCGSRFMKLLPQRIYMKAKRMVKVAIRSLRNRSTTNGGNGQGHLREKFKEVYDQTMFAARTSRSGEGADLVQTEVIRRELPNIVKEFSIQTFLDAPCGDWFWMREVRLGVKNYIGVDIVEALIEKNMQHFGSADCSFLCRNLAEDELPEADLVFCRDCFVHLKFEDIWKVIANFKRSNSKYLLTTTFTHRDKNYDLVGNGGFWQTLNLQLPPFNFPAPLKLINENCTEENNQYTDKCLGLWRLEDIRI